VHPDADYQKDPPDDPEGNIRGHSVCNNRQVRCLSICDAAARFYDGLCQNCSGHRPRSIIQKAGDMEHGGFIMVSVVLGIAMVAEARLLLWIGWERFGLATNNNALYTFSFLTLLYFAVFSIVSARERRWFWATKSSGPRPPSWRMRSRARH
jgi:hypothetical protein